MELILWRAAEAEEGAADLERRLTAKGRRHAERTAEWLQQRLPARFTLLTSPAQRARQTAAALLLPAKVERTLAPGAGAAQILDVAGWPDARGLVLLVGHQPDFGAVLGRLLSGGPWSVKKSGLWWVTNRMRNEAAQVVVRAVLTPDLLL